MVASLVREANRKARKKGEGKGNKYEHQVNVNHTIGVYKESDTSGDRRRGDSAAVFDEGNAAFDGKAGSADTSGSGDGAQKPRAGQGCFITTISQTAENGHCGTVLLKLLTMVREWVLAGQDWGNTPLAAQWADSRTAWREEIREAVVIPLVERIFKIDFYAVTAIVIIVEIS